MRRSLRIGWLAMGLAICAAGSASAEPPFRFETLDRAPTAVSLDVLKGRPAVLAFWRADCGPCLIELMNLAELKAAAGRGRIVFIGLQPPDVLKAELRKIGVDPAVSWRTRDDPAAVLTALGGAPPRLPLTVALKADGQVCGRRTGLLGTAQVRSWMASC